MTAPSIASDVWRVSEEVLKYHREDGRLYLSGQLRIVAAVAGSLPVKAVGIRYTLDHWATFQDCDGERGSDDRFVILSPSTLPPDRTIGYAIYCRTAAGTSWDNNHGLDYWAQL